MLVEVEFDPYCQQVLAARQKEGFLPDCPIFSNIETFDPAEHPECREVTGLTGGFPCQVPW